MPNNSEDKALIALVSKIVSENTGVILGDRQKQMVQGRVARRVRECGLGSQEEYHQFLLANMATETAALVSLLTTHHTFFFREYEHFEHLLNKTLPEAIANMRATGRKKFRVLSAACSKGHEVYSLAMFLKQNIPADLDFEIVGGDVCTDSVKFAKNGVYRWDEAKTIPATYLHGNWARGTGAISEFVKVSDSLRSKCQFEVMNLAQMAPAATNEKFDVVFCRNVFIYFEKELVKSSASKLLEKLYDHGELIIGLSESLNGLDLPVIWQGPSVYRRKGQTVSRVAELPKNAAAPKPPEHSRTKPSPIRIFAIDDSGTILKLIEKMCKEVGLEFIGSAKDGEEALRVLTGPNAPQPSLITLDLHMPKMNGLEFLKEFRKVSKTPVIVVSSINREENQLAQQALAAGAGDYVEKPAMDRWQATTSELVAKIRVIAKSDSSARSGVTELDSKFSRTSTSTRRWVLVANEAGREKAMAFASLHRDRVDLVVINAQTVGGAAGGGATAGLRISSLKDAKVSGSSDQRSILVFGESDEAIKAFIGTTGAARVLIEETIGAFVLKTHLRLGFGPLVDVCPVSSFAYEADKFVTVGGRASDAWQKQARKAS